MIDKALMLGNAAGSITIALFCVFAALHCKGAENLLTRLGLALACIGHIGSASLLIDAATGGYPDVTGLLRSHGLSRIGVIAIAVSFILRHTEAGLALLDRIGRIFTPVRRRDL
ncbi:MAG: hypothetical protein RLZZ373_2662 [Pseudomonadota bacterium]|jgi:hypothetical protein